MALDFPMSPSDGEIFDRYIYNADKGTWDVKQITAYPYYVGSTPPDDPTVNSAWFNVDTGASYLYYSDGDSSQWIQLGLPGPKGATIYAGPTEPDINIGIDDDYYINTTTHDLSQRSGDTWTVLFNLVGPQGETGPAGPGFAAGGLEGQILAKLSETDYDTQWIDNYAPQVKHLVKNATGSTITKGSVVYVTGSNGTNMTISLADADTEATSSKTMGLVSSDILNGEEGYVITEGLLAGLNTATATAGQSVWLSSTAGGWVYGSAPAKPAHGVYLGVVTRVHAVNGEIFVKVQNGYELEELHNVNINSGTLADKQVLKYDGPSSLWINGVASGGVTTGDTPPEDPNLGDGWFDTTSGYLYIWYTDVDSSQWVEVKANSADTAALVSRVGNIEDKLDFPIQLNTQDISSDYTIPSGYNGMSAGPITIADGVIVTIPDGSSWSIV